MRLLSTSRVAAWVSALAVIVAAPGVSANEAALSFSRAAQPSPHAATSLLLDITRVGDRLVTVGEQGHIIYSDSDGQQWTHADVPVSLMLTAVEFPTESRGWAVGHDGIVLASDDRGATWKTQLTGLEIAKLQLEAATMRVAQLESRVEEAGEEQADLDLLDALDEARFDVEDMQQLQDEGIVTPLLGVTFLSDTRGYAFGAYGLFIMTQDGGENWSLISGQLKNVDRYHFYDLAATSSGHLTITGEAGTIFSSSPDGNSWQKVTIDYLGSLFGVEVTPNDTLITFGLRGKIFRSVDNGLSWTPVETSNQSTLTGGKVLSDGRIVLVGASGTVLVSSDDGVGFTPMDSGTRDVLSNVEIDSAGELLVTGFGGVRTLGK